MLKKYKREIVSTVGVSFSALFLGAAVSAVRHMGWMPQIPWLSFGQSDQVLEQLSLAQDKSAILPLVSLSPKEREEQLGAIAKSSPSLDQSRARYLLAADLIQQNRGGAALPLLKGLEKDYAVLAPEILVKRAQGYTASGDGAKAEATWKELLQKYPDDPAAAEALFALGKTDPHYWHQVIELFPAHPRSIQIAQTRLEQNSNQLPMLLVLARHGLYLPNIEAILDRLMNEYAEQLRPEDWEAIAFGYWELELYGSASHAYEQAPRTPLNLYRTGRGAQLGERYTDAISAYQQLVQAFPDADETPLTLLRLAQLVESPQTALMYADQLIQRFPDHAAEALLERSKILDQLQSAKSASQARQSVLTQYSKSDAAAELRWTLAEQRFRAGDIKGAWELAEQLVRENPESEYAPEAAFWLGKWTWQLGQQQQARTAFEYVLTHYPESYYAWRSAVHLGWNVGDFTDMRSQSPQLVKSGQHPVPPSGSPSVQELYQLGQYRDAWSLWQVEFTNRVQPTVTEQFTDGLIRLGVGNNLDGLFMVSNLSYREKPEDRAEYRNLKQQTAYWQALYPFPFLESIQAWSQQRRLNPMLVTGLVRQESRFEPKIVSVAGATGLMQVMPGTADWIAQQIGLSDYDLTDPNDNIKLGTWYLDFTHQEYANNSLFAVASYNAGPGNVADWINRFGFSDPDMFIEQIPFPETKGYVKSVFENYWNYLRLYNPNVSQQLARYSPTHVEAVSFLP
jgi:soluble lytic murein transglycosylase